MESQLGRGEYTKGVKVSAIFEFLELGGIVWVPGFIFIL